MNKSNSHGEANASRRLERPPSRLIHISVILAEMGYGKRDEAASCHPPEQGGGVVSWGVTFNTRKQSTHPPHLDCFSPLRLWCLTS